MRVLRRSESTCPAWLVNLITMGCLAFCAGCSRPSASNPETWAEVGGQPITRGQVERYYHQRVAANADAGKEEQALSFKLSLLNELIDEQILLRHASHSGISVSEAEVDKQIAQMRSPYSEGEFQKKLSDQGWTLSDLREEVRQSLMVNKLINRDIASRLSVNEAEITEYYQHNKSTYNIPETQYHLAQILVSVTPDPQSRNHGRDQAKGWRTAERKIHGLYVQLRKGDDFAKLAQQYSEDPRTAPGGGDMGFIPASSLASDPQLGRTLSTLKIGQFSGIIRDRNGFHIVKILGREEAGQRDLSNPQVQSNIRQTLMNEKEQVMRAAYVETLRNKSKVINYLAERIVESGGDLVGLK